MAGAVEILTLVPDVAAIGQIRLQAYCDEWLQRPISRQFGLAQLNVTPELRLEVTLDEQRAEFVDDKVFIPIDELLGYIIDQHFTDSEKLRHLHEQLRGAKRRINDTGHEFEAIVGKVGRLYLKCKNPNCDALIETSHRATQGQTVHCPPTCVTCPACGHADTYDRNDLKLIFRD
jgi:hypothetical protein